MRSLFKERPHFQRLHLPFRPKSEVPANLWIRCEQCHELLYVREYEKNLKVCPKCDHHARLTAHERIEHLLDHGSFVEEDAGLVSADPLGFASLGQTYPHKLAESRARTRLAEAIVCGRGNLQSLTIRLTVCDFG